MNPSRPISPPALLNPARQIIERLRDAGHEAYIAGGAVRDWLLGRPPRGDLDIATSARPEAVRELFPRTLAVGESFGVLIVHLKGHSYEVATFRTEGGYTDGRHPDRVDFADARADVARRDFTINGLFFDPLTERVHDWVAGREDLAAGLIRTIGNPRERFGEDRLRLLRAVRFAAQLGFRIEAGTEAALHELASEVASVSMERIRAELDRLLGAPGAADGLRLLRETGLGEAVARKAAEGSADRRHAPLDLRPFVDGTALLAAWLAERSTPPEGFPAAEWWLLFAGWLGLRAESIPHQALPRELERLGLSLRLSRNEFRQIADAARALLLLHGFDGARLADRLRLLRHDGRPLLEATLAVVWPSRAKEFLATLADLDRLHGDRLHPEPLLDGHRLHELGVPGGPELGAWLLDLESEQLEGRLETVPQAEAWVARRLATSTT